MTLTTKKPLTRPRLFKMFTDLGPYFRRQHSTESSFFFDCLEICIDAEKKSSEREFLGWNLRLTKEGKGFSYTRLDGLYNLSDEWLVQQIDAEQQHQIDSSFDLFISRLQSLIEDDMGLHFNPLQPLVLTVPD